MVAGEASGDLLAGLLMEGLRVRWPAFTAQGIGGARMREQGFDAWWPSEKLAVRGYVEVLRHYRELVGIRNQLCDRLIGEGQESSYDMAFIDADKSSYDAYYERCLRLVRPGGLIAVDNVLWGGRVVDDQVDDEDTLAIRALNDKIAADERVSMVLLPVADGITLARVR